MNQYTMVYPQIIVINIEEDGEKQQNETIINIYTVGPNNYWNSITICTDVSATLFIQGLVEKHRFM